MIQLSDHFTYQRLLRFCLPSIIMMVFTSIYGVVDGLFVSNFVGKSPFAALNLIYPFVMILGGAGFMVGTGGSALVAKTLGEQNRERANRCFSMLVGLTVVLGLALTAAGLLLLRPVARLLGATGGMMEHCVRYGTVLLIFLTAFMLQNTFQSFFIAAEKPKLGLLATVLAGVTNMGLDALFVAGFRWGLAGAALATGMSQCVGALIPLFYFLRPNGSLLRLTRAKPERRVLVKACTNGSSELMSSISSSLVSMLYNFQLLRLAGENGVAAYGVLMYVQFVFIAVLIGYAIGTAPIVSFHYGANNRDELKSLLRKSLLLMGGAGCLMTLLAQILAVPLSRVFVGYDAALHALTVRAFRICAFSFLMAGVNIFASSFFTALNNGGVSAAISFLRTLVFQSAAVLLLPVIWKLDGVWLAGVVAELFALLISAVFLITQRKKYHY